MLLSIPALLGASCEASVGTDDSISAKELEKTATKQLEAANDGLKVESLDCTKPLEARKGAKVYCAAVFAGTDGLEQRVRIKVKSVEDGTASFDITALQLVEAGTLATSASESLSTKLEGADVNLDCGDEPIEAESGASVDCDAKIDGDPRSATITFSSDDGDFDVEVDPVD